MKKYPFLEAMSAVDEKFLEEVLNDSKEQERRQISMNKRRTVTIMIAAALIMTMAVTAVAAGISKISTLGDYFEGHRQSLNIPDEVPIMRNPDDYAYEVTTSTTTAQTEEVNGVVDATEAVDTYTPPAPGEAKILAVSATKHNMYMTVEFNVAGLDLPKELPEDSSPTGEWYFGYEDMEANFIGALPNMELMSYENDIMTYGFWFKHPMFLTDKSVLTEEERAQDEFILKLKSIGYTAYSDPTPEGYTPKGYRKKEYQVVRDVDFELRVPLDEIEIMEPIRSTNTTTLMGVDGFTIELSPYDMDLRTSIDNLTAAGIDATDEESFLKMSDYFWKELVIEFHMLDGSSFYEDFTKFTHNIINGGVGGANGATYGFWVPLDIAQIDYITINDARFDFAH